MSENEKFDSFIKRNSEFKTKNSQAELDKIKDYIKRKNSFFNPFLPFLAASSLVLVFTFIFVIKNTKSQITPSTSLEENIAETFLFESYFAIEDDIENSDADEDLSI